MTTSTAGQRSIPSENSLQFLATGRTESCFAQDFAACRQELKDALSGKRVLVVGGAGSIGSAAVEVLTEFSPKSLHVVDQSENSLVEVVRNLRSRPEGVDVEDLRTLPLDYGTPIMRAFLRANGPYDAVFNFAALKHVRSEKDPYSLLQMLETNISKQVRFMSWLRDTGFSGRYYCVSTDKAANPVSLMGASKRLMEHVMFSSEAVSGFTATTTSARFANVAFSNGSLPQAFLMRHRVGQPMAVPAGVRRYFISHREAAEISLLSWLRGSQGNIAIPTFSPEEGLVLLQDVAENTIRHLGFEPRHYDDEDKARRCAAADIAAGFYPLLVTPLDTAGEKPYEEFVGDGEKTVDLGLKDVVAVDYLPAPTGTLGPMIQYLDRVIRGEEEMPKKEDVVRLVAACIPQFHHIETGRNLDQRM
ncbi:MAG TPA: polysaccharide biosynthesis protein [Magnetospirillum sp.]|nr:polysaccharide biosynthesis protein [Magnetospirillum sp.]